MPGFAPTTDALRPYDRASLVGQRALPGRTLASSASTGWRSALIEQMHWPAGTAAFETRPSSDLRISMVLRGAHQTEVRVDGQWCKTEANVGAIAVTAAGDVDELRWRSDVPIETIHLFIPADTISAAACQLTTTGMRLQRAVPSLSFADPAVAGVLTGLLSAAKRGAPDLYGRETVRWLSTHLLLTHRLAAAGKTAGPYDPRIARAITCIQQRYADPLSLEQLAAVACISKFHFARLFRLETGMSPHAYLLRERLKAARTLLATSDTSIARIAVCTGFVRTSNFAVAFRGATGMTASEYRQRRAERSPA